ncbi:hypothetical protein A6U84_25725 (plasmid) [Agrobacterium sp. 13-2099-1-2]|uniref:hypothetical protein n=1 Tax=Agrobacterium sp. 13-2099-1-2 TaxID=1841651 RepID=UPI0008100B9A|nr:hypothetical protein [Agrobacterium sp. 13-2099-1-2]UZX45542.1 hypothetical protein A6U84_25725 [Agrobacterium sp. 13-2099-1-2]
MLCKNTRVLALYNTYSVGKNAQRISQEVRRWFLEKARQDGWDSAIFVNDVETRHSAGCLLLKRMDKVEINLFIGAEVEEKKKKPAALINLKKVATKPRKGG